MPPSTHSLVRKTLAGDRDAFGELAERHVSLVRGVIYEIVRDREESLDLVQDTFCKAYEGISQLQSPRRFGPWLRTIAVNVAYSWLRRHEVRSREETLLKLRATQAGSPLPDEAAESRQTARLLWEAVDRLPPECRRVVVLHHLEQCSLKAIASFVGVSKSTARWRLRRSYQLLRDEVVELLQATGPQESRRELRDKAMAGLPLAFILPLAERRSWWSRWLSAIWPRLAGLAGIAATVGLLGLVWQRAMALVPGEPTFGNARAGVRTRLGDIPLPEWSLAWEPKAPEPGQPLRVAARSAAGILGETPVLHWLTEPPPAGQDHVAEMAADDDQWVAWLDIPDDAAALFVYITTEDREPIEFDMRWPRDPLLLPKLRRYSRSILLRRPDGMPVRGGRQALGKMAVWTDSSLATAVAHFEAETRSYPDNLRAYIEEWHYLRQLDVSGRGDRQIAADQQRLADRFADSTSFALTQVAQSGPDAVETYWQMRDRGASEESLSYLSQLAVLSLRKRGEPPAAITILEQGLGRAVDPRLRSTMAQQLLELVEASDPDRALVMADSILVRSAGAEPTILYPPSSFSDGTTLEGLAVSTRASIYRSRGSMPGVRREAARLIALQPPDPRAHLHVGRVLAGLLPPWRDQDTLTRTPADIFLAADLFRAGAGAAQEWGIARALHLELSRCCLMQGRMEEAVDEAEMAAQLQREEPWYDQKPEPYLAMGAALEQLGRWREARDAYLGAIEPSQANPDVEREICRIDNRLPTSARSSVDPLAEWHPRVPDVTLRDMAGLEVRLHDSPGPLLLYYDMPHLRMPQPWGEREHLVAWQQRFRLDSLRVVAVANVMQGLVEFRRRLEADPVPFSVVVDDGRVYEALEPHFGSVFLLDRGGYIHLRINAWEQWERVGDLIEYCLQRMGDPPLASSG